MTYDLLIKNGTLYDGTGAPGVRSDVGVVDGRVVATGKLTESATQTIDADGQVVCPGIIDVHTHYDAQVLWDATLSPSPLHGVTTVMAGNCGFSIAPLSPESSGYLKRMLARVEGMPLAALEHGPGWDWGSHSEYFERFDGTLAINAGFLVGHSAIRRVVMGDEATERRDATEAELDAMRSQLRTALGSGVIGLSSSWSPSHLDDTSGPVPSLVAGPDEIRALARVVGEFAGTSIEFIANFPGDAYKPDERDLLVAVSVEAQRPVNWNIVQPKVELEFAESKLSVGDQARAAGGKVVGLVMPKSGGFRMNFHTAFLLDCIPGWQETMGLPLAARIEALRDPSVREHLDRSAKSPEAAGYQYTNWATYSIYETASADTKRFEGRNVGDIAREQSKSPFDALLDIVVEDRLLTSYGSVPPEPDEAMWQKLCAMMRNRNAVIGGSDAGAHLDMLGMFDYGTYLLGASCRGVAPLPLHELIAMVTSVPADLYGLHDRGRLVQGSRADILVFDPNTVGTEPLYSRYDLPGGGGRLYAGSTGVSHVFVSGTEIVRDGAYTGARPGQILRRGVDTVTPSLL